MKYQLSTLFFILIFASSFAQIPDYAKIRINETPDQKSTQNIKMKLDSIVMSISMGWEFKLKNEFYYDETGILVESYSYGDEENSGWIGQTKDEFFYNDDGIKTHVLNYEWSGYMGDWSLQEKLEYTYNGEGLLIKCMEYAVDHGTGEWEVDGQVEYTYNSNGQLTKVTESIWDSYEAEWIIRYKHEYQYNEDGYLSNVFGYMWDQGFSTWLPIDKITYTYNDQDRITQSLYFSWNEAENRMEEEWKEEYVYDENGDLVQNIFSERDDESEELLLVGRYDYRYDISYGLNDLILPSFSDEITVVEALDASSLFTHKLDGFSAFLNNPLSGDWTEVMTGDYYYSQHIAGSIEEIENPDISIFPNPVDDIINFKDLEVPAELKIFSLEGQLLKSSRHVESNIDISNLQPGVYILELTSGEKKILRKVVKQ